MFKVSLKFLSVLIVLINVVSFISSLSCISKDCAPKGKKKSTNKKFTKQYTIEINSETCESCNLKQLFDFEFSWSDSKNDVPYYGLMNISNKTCVDSMAMVVADVKKN